MMPSKRTTVGMSVLIVMGISLLSLANPAAARICSPRIGDQQGLLETTVRYHPDSAKFEYRYTLTNPPDAPMRLGRLVVGYTPPVTRITGPDVWLKGIRKFLNDGTLTFPPAAVSWRSHKGRSSGSDEKPPDYRALVERDVSPGDTVGGFGFYSPNPPTFSQHDVYGQVKLADTEVRARAHRWMRHCEGVSRRSLLGVVVQGTAPSPHHGLRVRINVEPNKDSIRNDSDASVPVTLFGSDTFSVQNASETQALFGVSMAQPVGAGEIKDVNEDGHKDLVFNFPISSLGLRPGDHKVALAVTLNQPLRRRSSFVGFETFRAVWGTEGLNGAEGATPTR